MRRLLALWAVLVPTAAQASFVVSGLNNTGSGTPFTGTDPNWSVQAFPLAGPAANYTHQAVPWGNGVFPVNPAIGAWMSNTSTAGWVVPRNDPGDQINNMLTHLNGNYVYTTTFTVGRSTGTGTGPARSITITGVYGADDYLTGITLNGQAVSSLYPFVQTGPGQFLTAHQFGFSSTAVREGLNTLAFTIMNVGTVPGATDLRAGNPNGLFVDFGAPVVFGPEVLAHPVPAGLPAAVLAVGCLVGPVRRRLRAARG